MMNADLKKLSKLALHSIVMWSKRIIDSQQGQKSSPRCIPNKEQKGRTCTKQPSDLIPLVCYIIQG